MFGWIDGIYLRLGGMHYEDIEKGKYSCQFRASAVLEIFVFGILSLAVMFFVNDLIEKYVLLLVCLSSIFYNLRYYLIYLLQATNCIKKYAIIIISEKVCTVLLLIIFLTTNNRAPVFLIFADVFGKIVSFCISVFFCRDIVFSTPVKLKLILNEIKENISSGFKLMIANLASMLIIGVIRFGIQQHWDVATFGKVSLSLSVSNMALQAISAISMVLYPTLRRINQSKLSEMYKIMRMALIAFIFGILIFYYPIQQILSSWLPQYAESLRYAAILFPVCVYDSKMSMLLNTYFKTLRLENKLMKCNIAAVVFSVIAISLSAFVFDNLTLAVISILAAVAFRGILAENVLSKYINIQVKSDIVLELLMTISFIVCNWFFGYIGMIAFAAIYIVYLFIKRNDLKFTLRFINSLRK